MKPILRPLCAALAMLFVLTACSPAQTGGTDTDPSPSASAEVTPASGAAEGGEGTPAPDGAEGGEETASLSPIPRDAWQYNAESDVYWQVGLAYCASPADVSYETLGIFVPGAYFEGSPNGDGTYTCSRSAAGTVGALLPRPPLSLSR